MFLARTESSNETDSKDKQVSGHIRNNLSRVDLMDLASRPPPPEQLYTVIYGMKKVKYVFCIKAINILQGRLAQGSDFFEAKSRSLVRGSVQILRWTN